MSQASPQSMLRGSGLVRALGALTGRDSRVSHEQFAARLAQLVNLSDSISLSAAHNGVDGRAFKPVPTFGEELQQEYQRVRNTLIQTVRKSFEPTLGPSRIKLPAAGEPQWTDCAAACAPYLKFYSAHQAQLDVSIQGVQLRTRNAASGLSPKLAQLAALDLALADILYPRSRQSFAAIPSLLAQRFEQLLQQAQQATEEQLSEQHWTRLVKGFCSEMRTLLLAEIDARLLPTLGLLEAINEETETTKP